MINLKDMNGQWVCVDDDEIMSALVQGMFTLCGLTFKEILELKKHKDSLQVETIE